MKILFFLEDYYLGGLDTFVINLINSWPDPHDELILICNHQHTGISYIKSSLQRKCSVCLHRIIIFTSFFELTKTQFFEKVLKILFKITAPISRYVFFFFNVFALKKLLRKFNANRLLVINGGYPGGDSCRAALVAWAMLGCRPKAILNFHGIVTRPPFHTHLQEHFIDTLMLRSTKTFITVSKTAAQTMKTRSIIASQKTIHYIYNGISILSGSTFEKNNIKKELSIENDSLLCIMLGAYHQHKNFDKGHLFLFHAFRKVLERIPNAHLLICGYGSIKDQNRVKQYAKDCAIINNTHFFGFRHDVPELLSQIDVLLVASQKFESFCFAAIEAMAHRIPVVATRVGALPEIISNGDGGYCIEKDDVNSYAHHLAELLGNNNLRQEQGERAFLRYQNFFTAKEMALRYHAMIKDE